MCATQFSLYILKIQCSCLLLPIWFKILLIKTLNTTWKYISYSILYNTVSHCRMSLSYVPVPVPSYVSLKYSPSCKTLVLRCPTLSGRCKRHRGSAWWPASGRCLQAHCAPTTSPCVCTKWWRACPCRRGSQLNTCTGCRGHTDVVKTLFNGLL